MEPYAERQSPPGPMSPAARQDAGPGAMPREGDYYRRRSPAPHHRRSYQRPRSRSPVAIDRYQPDPNYGSFRDRDERRRPASPPPANIDRYVPGQDTRPIIVNPIPNPHKLDYQVGFSYFSEWWRFEKQIEEQRDRQRNPGRRPPDRVKGEREAREDRAKEKAQIQIEYDAYKEALQVRMAKTFVQAHRNDEWFKERYVDENRAPFRQRLNDFRRATYAIWERDIEAGTFDEFTLEGIYKGDSDGVGGLVEKEEGETVAAAEVLGVGDLLPSKGGDIRDETAFQPALLIKTIAPTVSRGKIEEFCKEHLGESDGGFKWLSLSDPNPSKRFHRIGWVMLHPSSEPDMSRERGDGRDEDEIDEDGTTRSDAKEQSSGGTAEKALEAINGQTIKDETRGDFTCHVGVHVPPSEPRKKALWDLFSAPERVRRDLELAKRLVTKLDQESNTDFDGLTLIESKVDQLHAAGLLQPAATTATGSKKTKASRQNLAMETDDLEDGEEEEQMQDSEDEGAFDEEVDDEALIYSKKTLDLLVEYLRRVYNFCFFCVFESDSVHELARKCPGGHLRRPRASLSTAAKAIAKASASGEPFPQKKKEAKEEGANGGSPEQAKFRGHGSKNDQQLQRAYNWVKTFEDKIFQILEPENVDIKKLGGKPVDEAMDEELAKYVKQEDESKFRCKVPECTKLFKGKDFWKKHVEKRHPEWLTGLRQDLNLVNSYVLDPAHIAPSRSDANSNGHFPNNNHMSAGTPRGFNLTNMPVNFNPALMGNGMFPTPTGFPQTFGHHAVQMPNPWGPPGADFNGGGDDRHHPGPNRRGAGGNYRNNARTGPYERRGPRDGRDMRRNAGGAGGRMSPPRAGMGMRGGAGKWGDGAGGAAVGPREAVQGRSLKSYEDLDAVGSGGGGELNY